MHCEVLESSTFGIDSVSINVQYNVHINVYTGVYKVTNIKHDSLVRHFRSFSSYFEYECILKSQPHQGTICPHEHLKRMPYFPRLFLIFLRSDPCLYRLAQQRSCAYSLSLYYKIGNVKRIKRCVIMNKK